MKVEAVGAEYGNLTMNINNEQVVFKNNIAEVPDDLGQSMIEDFPHFFPKGKVVTAKKEKVVHVFDETKYQQQEGRIIQLHNSLKTKSQHIDELNAQMADWKRMYEEMSDRFALMKSKDSAPSEKSTEKPTEKPKKEVLKSDDDQGKYRERLETKGLKELKSIAEELNVPTENVKRKIAKEDWIDAIIDITFST